VKGILGDINIQGYVDHLVAIMQAEPWKLFWDHFGLQYVRFQDVGLAAESPDSLVWQTCQQHRLLLLTDNRSQHTADSLQATINTYNALTSLPVFTIGDVRRLHRDRAYADEIIDSLFVYLLQGDNILGTGRLFLP
jgi:hypothetical protein